MPPAVVAEITAAVAAVAADLNRYPDREFTDLRTALAEYLSSVRHRRSTPAQVWAGNGSNEVLQHVRAGVRRPRPHRARLHARLLDAPDHQRVGRQHLGRRAARAGRHAVRPHRRVRGRPGARARPARGLPLLAEQPDRHRPGPRRRRGRVCRGRAGRRRRGRGLRRVRPPGDAQRADPAAGPPAAGRHPHHEQGVRLRRRPARLPRRRPGAGRRPAPGPAALPPVGAHPGDRAGGPAARPRDARAPSR